MNPFFLMLRAPEPSSAPVAALYIALVAGSSITAATAVFLQVIHG